MPTVVFFHSLVPLTPDACCHRTFAHAIAYKSHSSCSLVLLLCLITQTKLNFYIKYTQGTSISLLYFYHNGQFSIYLCADFIQGAKKKKSHTQNCRHFCNHFITDLQSLAVLFLSHSLWWQICGRDEPTREKINNYKYDSCLYRALYFTKPVLSLILIWFLQ